MKIAANGISINYEIAGEGDWLVLIHGAGDNLGIWYNQVPVFSGHYKVITYDTRGHGQTEVTEGNYTAAMWAEDLHGLLKTLGVKRAFVLGYSLGSMIASAFATERPEMVKALVLVGVAGAAVGVGDRETWMARRNEQIELLETEGMLGVLRQRIDPVKGAMFSPGFAKKNPQVVRQYSEVFKLSSAEGYRKVLESMGQRGRPVDFSAISCRTLVIVGDADVWSGPEAGRALQQRIPGSELVILPTGHACHLERPDLFNETVLSFLSPLQAASGHR
ncbi:MAG: 3-oxoadipate enol-lactonase [Deltaproteobacteria bacterium]|jgi:3-oxoadipate enol-lactonase|nr:3-oxoadipate enol-lactonase [Deltaproteobacteria bacterium]